MKKYFAFIFVLFLISQPVFAEIESFHIDGRVSAFFPSDKLFRKIYGDCLVNYEIEIGKVFCNNYELWANVGWLSKHGKSSPLLDKTRFENTTLSAGGKYIYPINACLQLYLGLGINGSFVHVHNNSHYVKRNVNKEGVGGVAKLGLYYELYDNLFLEIFSDYLYQRMHFRRNIQIGGVKVGGGVGFTF